MHVRSVRRSPRSLNRHLSACRRWRAVPPPAEYLSATTEAVAARSRGSAPIEAEDFELCRPDRGRRSTSRRPSGAAYVPSTASTSRLRRPDARRRRRERQRQDHRRARHHRPHTGDRRQITLHGKPLPAAHRQDARGTRSKRSRWSSRTRDASLNPTRSVGDAIMRPPDAARRLTGQQATESGAANCCRRQPAVSYYDRLPARAQRRREAACGDRPSLCRRAGADPLRRADLLAGRLGAGLAHEPAHEAAASREQRPTCSSPTTSRRSSTSPTSSRSSTWADHGDRRRDHGAHAAVPPVHRGPALGRPAADPDVKQQAIRLSAVSAERHGGALRLPLPSSLPALPRRHLPRAGATVAGRSWGDHRIYCHIPLEELRATPGWDPVEPCCRRRAT